MGLFTSTHTLPPRRRRSTRTQTAIDRTSLTGTRKRLGHTRFWTALPLAVVGAMIAATTLLAPARADVAAFSMPASSPNPPMGHQKAANSSEVSTTSRPRPAPASDRKGH